jgi:hypothetical protein
MVPNFYVTVWYHRSDGEIVSDALLVQLPANLKNSVSRMTCPFWLEFKPDFWFSLFEGHLEFVKKFDTTW